MSEILTEPSSQRSDNKIWVWRYGDPVNVPVKVSFFKKSDQTEYFKVPTTMYARFLVKSDLRLDDAVIDKIYHFIAPGIFIVELSTEEVIQLRAGKTYYVGIALYDEGDNFVRTLVADLPLRVDKSVLSNQVF